MERVSGDLPSLMIAIFFSYCLLVYYYSVQIGYLAGQTDQF